METTNFLGFFENNLLCEITIPGSHDAGITDDAYQSMWVGWKSNVVTQKLTVLQQAMLGSRFFDIRLKKRGGVIKTHHSPVDWPILNNFGGTGQNFDSILDEALSFVKTFGSEFLIIRLAHLIGSEEILQGLNRWIIKNRSYVYRKSGNLANVPVRDLAGKLIFLVEKKSLFKSRMGQTDGFHTLYQNKDGMALEEVIDGLCVCGSYSNSRKLNVIVNGQLDNYMQHDHHRDNNELKRHLHCLYWTATLGNIKGHTKKMHKNFELCKQMANRQDLTGNLKNIPAIGDVAKWRTAINAANKARTKYSIASASAPNIILYDFISSDISKEIIGLNDLFRL